MFRADKEQRGKAVRRDVLADPGRGPSHTEELRVPCPVSLLRTGFLSNRPPPVLSHGSATLERGRTGGGGPPKRYDFHKVPFTLSDKQKENILP